MKTIAEVKEANKKEGHHFFSKDTMNFFNSKIESKLYQDKYFITSEKYDNGPRLYSIRKGQESGIICTVGNFQRFKTIEEARFFIKNLK